jgi:hypothetical protein
VVVPGWLGHDLEQQADRLELRVSVKLFLCRSVHDLFRELPLSGPLVVLTHQREVLTAVTIVVLQSGNEWAVGVVPTAFREQLMSYRVP